MAITFWLISAPADRVSASGVQVEAEGFHLWTLHAGRAVRFTTYDRRDEALEAAGLRE
jgi:hypothetical protein